MYDDTTAVRPKRERIATARKARATAAGKAYRAAIGSLLDESTSEQLARVWQRVSPFRIDPACELPDRRAIIEDLADFAMVFPSSLHGMTADRLLRLIEKYAAYEPRQSDPPVSLLAPRTGTPSPRPQKDLILAGLPRAESLRILPLENDLRSLP